MSDYAIGVKIMLASNGAAVLGLLSRQLLGVHGHVRDLEGGFSRLKLGIVGALGAVVGVGAIDAMVKLIDKTAEYSDELAKLKTLGGGMTAAVASGAISAQAFDIAQRVPMKVTDLLKIPGAGYSILGEEDAAKVWEPLARFQWILQNQASFKGDAGEDMSKFLRASELGGRLTDPTTHKAAIAELERFLDLSQRVMAATHGMVTPSTMLGAAQQAGFSMRDMSDEGFMNQMIMAQAMGGPRAGTALLSLYNQVGAGKMTRASAQGMQDLNLLGADDWYSDHGQVVVKKEALGRLGHMLGHNPMDFIDEIYKNLDAQGVTDPEEQKRRVAQAISRQTSERFVTEGMMNRGQIHDERERMAQGMGTQGAFNVFGDESVTNNMRAMTNAWDNLLVAVAGPNSQNAIAVMKELTGAINSVTSFANAHPETIKILGEAIAAVAIALVGAGAATLIALAGLPAIITGIVAAAAALIALNWSSISSMFTGIASAISSFIDSIGALYHRIQGSVGWGPERDEAGRMKNPGLLDKYLWGDPDPHALPPINVPPENGGLKHPTLFNPGTDQPRMQQASFSLNVDGHALAQSVIDHLESIYGMPSSAAAADGVHSPFRDQYTST
jgi:hypothetical protein